MLTKGLGKGPGVAVRIDGGVGLAAIRNVEKGFESLHCLADGIVRDGLWERVD